MKREIKNGGQQLKVKLDGNTLVGVERSGRWIRIENPCDTNGNLIIQLPKVITIC